MGLFGSLSKQADRRYLINIWKSLLINLNCIWQWQLDYWRRALPRYPMLSQLAFIVLSIPRQASHANELFRWQVLSPIIYAPILPQKMLVFFYFWKSTETCNVNLTNEIDLLIPTRAKLWNQMIDIERPLSSFVYLCVRSVHNVCTFILDYIRN